MRPCFKFKIKKKENVIRLSKKLLYVYECFIYVHIFLPYPPSSCEGQKQGCYSFELEVETVTSHHGVVGTKPLPERLVI